MRRPSPVLVIVFALGLGLAATAHAHIVAQGVGMQTSLAVEPKRVAIEYNLGFSDLTGYEQVLKMDTDRSGIVTQAEIDAWLADLQPRIAAALEVTIDGKRIELAVARRRILALFPDTNLAEIAGAPFDTFWNLEAAVDLGPGEHEVVVRDRNFEKEIAQSLLWLPKPDPERFRSFAFETEPKGAFMESHPAAWCLYARQATVYVEFMPAVYAAAAALAPAPPDPGEAMRKKAEEAAKAQGVARYEEAPKPPPLELRGKEEAAEGRALGELQDVAWYVALGLALLWGAAHALAPGHGKSMVAAYLLGTEGRIGDAIALGAIVTITHAGIIFILAIALYFTAERVFGVSQATAHAWSQIILEVVSGFIVAAIGISLLVRRIRQYRRGEVLDDHDHGPGGHHHRHGHDHPGHEHRHAASGERRDILSLGLAAGLQPCTAGLALVFMSLAQGWLWKGLYLLLAFSLGLGLVLVAVALTMVIGRRILAEATQSSEGRFIRTVLPMASAVALAGVGIWMAIDALARNKIGPFA